MTETLIVERFTRKQIAEQVRRNCTPSSDAYAKGGDALIAAVADWIENPPEWVTDDKAAPAARPEIVVLCGSTRFYETFRLQNLRLTLEGKIVLSIGYDGKSDADLEAAGLLGAAPDKVALDELHKRKIDLADRVLVLNVNGYIGDSTRSEIEYAATHGKPIDWLENNIPPAAASGVLIADDFIMRWDAEHTFSFTESEDATIMAYGHPDPIALAAEISEYDRLCAGPFTTDHWETDPGDIRQSYAVLVEGGPGDEWRIQWGKDADTPGAFPVSVVAR